MRKAFLALIFAALLAAPASAQVCAGTASFASGGLQLTGAVSFSDNSRLYGAGVALGGATGFYGAGAIGRRETDGADATTVFGGTVGFALGHEVQICPSVTASREVYSAIGALKPTVDVIGGGLSLGGLAHVTPAFDVAPAISVHRLHATATASVGAYSASASTDYTVIGVALGFVIGQRFTLQPAFAVPVGLEGAKTAFSIGVSLNVGKR